MFGRSTKESGRAGSSQPRKAMSPSVIAADMHVLGNIISEGVLDIDGQIQGNVRCHTATIRENGKVQGDVVAETLHVHGTVEGLIKARSVMIYSTAHVVGTIMHETLSVEDGAFIDGKFKRSEGLLGEDEPKRLTHREANDNDEPMSDAERLVLDNLRLIR